jgi:hypothetical protein
MRAHDACLSHFRKDYKFLGETAEYFFVSDRDLNVVY